MLVLDTNILSADDASLDRTPEVAGWLHQRSPSEQLFTTSVSQAEILSGVEIMPDGRRRRDLRGDGQSDVRQRLRRTRPAVR